MIGVRVAVGLGRTAALSALPRPSRIRRTAGVLLIGVGVVQMYLYLFRFGGPHG